MLVTNIFSFSHNVFRRFLFQGLLKSGLWGKGLKKIHCTWSLITSFLLYSIRGVIWPDGKMSWLFIQSDKKLGESEACGLSPVCICVFSFVWLRSSLGASLSFFDSELTSGPEMPDSAQDVFSFPADADRWEGTDAGLLSLLSTCIALTSSCRYGSCHCLRDTYNNNNNNNNNNHHHKNDHTEVDSYSR